MQTITKTFNGTALAFVRNDDGDFCLSAEQIGQALGYADPARSVLNLVRRNADEFEGLQGCIEMTTPGGMQSVTVFAEEGIYLVGMKATTKQAKAFRKFVTVTLKELRKGGRKVSEVDRLALTLSQAFPVIAGQIQAAQATADQALAIASTASADAVTTIRQDMRDAAKLRGVLTKKVAELGDEALRRGFCDGNKRRMFQGINTDLRDRFGVRSVLPVDQLQLAIAYIDERHARLVNPNRIDLTA